MNRSSSGLGVDPPVTSLAAVGEWLGVSITDEQQALLERYAEWLVAEAIPAGGLGPREAERVWPRHILDSISFVKGLDPHGGVVVDVGSGVGLPGIPLAILLPQLELWLLDRGGRRTRLLERALHVLSLEAVVIQRDISDVSGSFEGLVFRGSEPLHDAIATSVRLLSPTGRTVFGLSRRVEVPSGTDQSLAEARRLGLEAELIEVPERILDGPAWLLKMWRRAG